MKQIVKNRTMIFLLGLLLILGIGLYYYFTSFLEHFDNNTQKVYAMSFGGGSQNFHDAVLRIKNELSNANVFDDITIYTDHDLKKDTSFWNKHKEFIENNSRGYGYWIWKPYLIMKTFEKMNNNDILLYLDAGCELPNNEKNKDKILELINKCNENNILYTRTGHNEKMYTKMDLIDYMNMNNDNIKNSTENQSGFIFVKKNEKTVQFINEWYTIACNYHLIDDSPSILQNDPSFVEHRHDQSIFSLLTKSVKYNFNNENNLIDSSPFLLSRKRSG
jgi:hypothetical protein